jgi:hypothetical protein
VSVWLEKEILYFYNPHSKPEFPPVSGDLAGSIELANSFYSGPRVFHLPDSAIFTYITKA